MLGTIEEQLLFTQHTVDNNSTPIMWLAAIDKVIYANNAACKLLGYSKEEILAKPAGFHHPMGTTEYWTRDLPILREKKAILIEMEFRRKNGTIVPLFVNSTYLEYQNQEYIILSFHDLSERKKMELELMQAQKMEAISTLAGGIAHDFNNILSAIFGYTELAKDDVDNPELLLKDLDKITNGAERARNLVKQLYTFSRKTEQEKRSLRVSLVVKEAIKLLRSSIPTTIEIRQDIQSDENILADPVQIHQIIMNLCTNAYHAMRETGGTLSIVLKETELTSNVGVHFEIAPGKYLMLEVSDTGQGMSQETKEKIFEPYFTTLGLSVTHGIVKDCKGKIDVYSEPDKGTVFKVYLPIFEGEEKLKEETIPIVGGDETIMLVDDEVSIIEVTTKFLIKYGYTVISFTNGVQALQEFQKQPEKFDLAITDMTMPYMTGTELSREIIELRSNFPVILCTGHSELINREKALVMGIKEYCEKPIDVYEILRTVRKVLDNAKLNGIRILFIDDVQFNVDLGKMVLERLGCEVVGMINPEDALDLFRKTPGKFDIIITDQNMPNLTGFELAEKVLEIRSDMPILMVTGDNTNLEELDKPAGIKGILRKPLEDNVLVSAINKAIR